MSQLLYVESSPRKDRSVSIEMARFFLEEYRERHPGDEIRTLDLWDIVLPEFDGETIGAKYAILHGQNHTPAQAKAWQAVVKAFNIFNAADRYLFSVPMWNFGVPYKLKHFIDVITQPGLSFSFTPAEGYRGLVTGKPAAVVYSRGGEYGPGSGAESFDLQKHYVDLWLGFIGFTEVHSIVVEPTLGGREALDRTRAAARESILELLQTF